MMSYILKKEILKNLLKEKNIDEKIIIEINNYLYKNNLIVEDFIINEDNINEIFDNLNDFFKVLNKNLSNFYINQYHYLHKYNYNDDIIISINEDEINYKIKDNIIKKIDVIDEDFIDNLIKDINDVKKYYEDKIVEIIEDEINNYLTSLKFNKLTKNIIEDVIDKTTSIINNYRLNKYYNPIFKTIKSSTIRSLFYNIFDEDDIEDNEIKFLYKLYKIYFDNDKKQRLLSFINSQIGYNKEIVYLDFFNEIDFNVINFLNMLDSNFNLNNYYYSYDLILIEDEIIIKSIDEDEIDEIVDDEIDEIFDEIIDNDLIEDLIDDIIF